MLSLVLGHVFWCRKISNNLYDNHNIWKVCVTAKIDVMTNFGLMIDLSHKIVLWNWPYVILNINNHLNISLEHSTKRFIIPLLYCFSDSSPSGCYSGIVTIPPVRSYPREFTANRSLHLLDIMVHFVLALYTDGKKLMH